MDGRTAWHLGLLLDRPPAQRYNATWQKGPLKTLFAPRKQELKGALDMFEKNIQLFAKIAILPPLLILTADAYAGCNTKFTYCSGMWTVKNTDQSRLACYTVFRGFHNEGGDTNFCLRPGESNTVHVGPGDGWCSEWQYQPRRSCKQNYITTD